MYDTFSVNYDRFVNWQGRLAFEMPLLLKLLKPLQTADGPLRILDAACGTGMHAIELARHGHTVCGADLSPGMIDQARQNAQTAAVKVRFETAGFGQLESTFGKETQDAVLCLGNSLPHALTAADRSAALQDFAACLRPGGILIIQNRNFDKVMNSRERWMEPQSHQASSDERVFLRFYDYLPDGVINFNIVTLQRFNDGWQQTVMTTQLYPLLRAELMSGLEEAGYNTVQLFGSMDGSQYNLLASDNLVVHAKKG